MFALLALASSASWGAADFLGGLASKRRPAVAVVAWTHVLALVGLTVIIVIRWDAAGWHGWPLPAAAAGLLGAAGLVCFYTALSIGTMGVVAPIAALGVLVPVMIGVARGESPSAWTWIGMLVAIVGVTFAAGPELSGDVSPRPVVLAALAALFFGSALWFIHDGSVHSTLMTLWGMRLTSTVVFAGLAIARRSVGGVRPADLPILLATSLGDVVANGLFGVATTRGQVSVASVLGSLYPIVTIVLARVVLHERLRNIQRAGVALSMAGAALIAGLTS